MQTRVDGRLAAIAIVSFACLTGLARNVSASVIELDNDVAVSWSDIPCTIDPALCDHNPVRVFGAPRLVPNASNVGGQLKIQVDFLSVGLDSPIGGAPNDPTPLFLNVFDTDGNAVLRPGGATPLQLTYLFAPTGLSVAVSDVDLNLTSFQGFELLPQGDLVFTVGFKPRFAVVGDRTPTRPDDVVIITVSGPGTEIVPEPGSLALLLCGLSGAWSVARWRRAGSA